LLIQNGDAVTQLGVPRAQDGHPLAEGKGRFRNSTFKPRS
jgi:hypothetical protein